MLNIEIMNANENGVHLIIGVTDRKSRNICNIIKYTDDPEEGWSAEPYYAQKDKNSPKRFMKTKSFVHFYDALEYLTVHAKS